MNFQNQIYLFKKKTIYQKSFQIIIYFIEFQKILNIGK